MCLLICEISDKNVTSLLRIRRPSRHDNLRGLHQVNRQWLSLDSDFGEVQWRWVTELYLLKLFRTSEPSTVAFMLCQLNNFEDVLLFVLRSSWFIQCFSVATQRHLHSGVIDARVKSNHGLELFSFIVRRININAEEFSPSKLTESSYHSALHQYICPCITDKRCQSPNFSHLLSSRLPSTSSIEPWLDRSCSSWQE